MRVITLYGRPGCHLCDDAREELARLGAELDFRLLERDITTDDALHRGYFDRIPVITLDGQELCDLFVDEAALRAALATPKRPGDDLESWP